MPRTSVKIDREVQEQMCRDYRQGMPVRQIATIYGIGRNKAYDIVKSQCEIKMGRPKGKCDIAVQSMMEDYINGLSVTKISKKYGCSYAHVFRLFARNGFNVADHQRPKRKDGVIEALKLGELSQSDIAKKYGVSRQYVFQVKQKMGGKENDDL